MSRLAVTLAGASARRRLCPLSLPSSARCRTVPAVRSRPLFLGRDWKGHRISPRSRRGWGMTVWTCCKPRIRCRGSRWHCGIFWGSTGRNLSGACWAMTGQSRKSPMPRFCSATPRKRPWRGPARPVPTGFARRNSAGVPSAQTPQVMMPTTSSPRAKASAGTVT